MPTTTAPDFDVKSLRGALKVRLDTINLGLAEGVKVDGSNVVVSKESSEKLRTAYQEAQEIKGYLNMHKMAQNGESWVDGDESSVAMQSGASGALDEAYKISRKSAGRRFVESAEFKSAREHGQRTTQPYEMQVFDLPSAGGGVKDIYNDLAVHNVPRGFGSIQFDPTVPRPHRQNRIRSLFPAAATNSVLIDFFQVIGYQENGGDGNAQSVPDRTSDNTNFGLKPRSNLVFRSAQAPIRTIAHWEPAHRNVLDDEPQLQALIDNELLYGLALEEDRQLLVGTGANDELTGILNTENIQIYNAPNGETFADSLRKSATLSMIAYLPSTGYVLHPLDWETIELSKDSQLRYQFVTNVAIGQETQIWRQPVVETVAIPEGTFLSGAFGVGAQIYDRQIANIRTAEQHEDFFVRNAIAVLAEQRIALAVKRPEAFVKGGFATS